MKLLRLGTTVAALLVACSLAACNDTTEPDTNGITLGALTVTTTSNKDTLVTGDTALITFRFSNPTDTSIRLTSRMFDRTDGKQCPVLVPVAAYPGTTTVYSFILSTCFGGTDTTLTGQYGLQNIIVPARGQIERTVPFTGYTRASTSATPRCLATGRQWVLPLFIIDGQPLIPIGTRDTDGPSLLFLKAPTANPAPCTTTGT